MTPVEEMIVQAATERLRANAEDLDALAVVGTYFLARGQADKVLDCFHRITRVEPKYLGI
jgi:cytochrome c-type biogenesis protein CcmH/NrfG